jgi:hypothetical protein
MNMFIWGAAYSGCALIKQQLEIHIDLLFYKIAPIVYLNTQVFSNLKSLLHLYLSSAC